MSKFNIMLRDLRKRNHMSQAALAAELGISRSAVGMYEQGEREPDFTTLEKIADFFNVDIDYILGRKPDSENAKPEPTYKDVRRLLARNGQNLTIDEKMRLIKLLSDL